MNYSNAYTTAVRYGRAPAEDISSMVKAAIEHGGQYEPHNTPDAVLADYLADHSDPREEIVRRDLAIRQRSPRWIDGVNAVEREVVGKDSRVAYELAETHRLVDGSRLFTSTYQNKQRVVVGHRVTWTPDVVGNDSHAYMGFFTPDEYTELITRLQDHIDHSKSK